MIQLCSLSSPFGVTNDRNLIEERKVKILDFEKEKEEEEINQENISILTRDSVFLSIKDHCLLESTEWKRDYVENTASEIVNRVCVKWLDNNFISDDDDDDDVDVDVDDQIKKSCINRFINKATDVRLFLREIITLASLQQSPNVIKMLGWRECFNESIIVTEKAHCTLRQLIDLNIFQGGKMINLLKKIFRDLLKGVADMHAQNIFHRDIKPENIVLFHPMLNEFTKEQENKAWLNNPVVNSNRKVWQEGWRKRLQMVFKDDEESEVGDGKEAAAVTEVNKVTTKFIDTGSSCLMIPLSTKNNIIKYTSPITTFPYAAPEVCMCNTDTNDGEYDLSCDIWSLGCVFAEMLNDNNLFYGEDDDKCRDRSDPDNKFLARNFNGYNTCVEPIFNKLGLFTSEEWLEGFTLLQTYTRRERLYLERYKYKRIVGKGVFPTDTAERRKEKVWTVRQIGEGWKPEERELLIDLLNHMIAYNPKKRLPANVLLLHPFFGDEACDIYKPIYKPSLVITSLYSFNYSKLDSKLDLSLLPEDIPNNFPLSSRFDIPAAIKRAFMIISFHNSFSLFTLYHALAIFEFCFPEWNLNKRLQADVDYATILFVACLNISTSIFENESSIEKFRMEDFDDIFNQPFVKNQETGQKQETETKKVEGEKEQEGQGVDESEKEVGNDEKDESEKEVGKEVGNDEKESEKEREKEIKNSLSVKQKLEKLIHEINKIISIYGVRDILHLKSPITLHYFIHFNPFHPALQFSQQDSAKFFTRLQPLYCFYDVIWKPSQVQKENENGFFEEKEKRMNEYQLFVFLTRAVQVIYHNQDKQHIKQGDEEEGYKEEKIEERREGENEKQIETEEKEESIIEKTEMEEFVKSFAWWFQRPYDELGHYLIKMKNSKQRKEFRNNGQEKWDDDLIMRELREKKTKM